MAVCGRLGQSRGGYRESRGVYGESMGVKGSLGESTYRSLWQSRAVYRLSSAVYRGLGQSR